MNKFFTLIFNTMIILLAFSMFALIGGWIFYTYFTSNPELVKQVMEWTIINGSLLVAFIGLRLTCFKKIANS